VAIKIKKAHDSTDDLDKDPEIQAMIALEKHYLEGPQDRPRGFIQLFDWFRHEGPNGIHNCLVMELLGPSLETILRTNVEMEDFLAPDTILRTSRQLLEAIEFAHQAGFVHGGMSVLIFCPHPILCTPNSR
jgi:serine/threonine-protein kinase SRPK3